jgi:HEAT repeat protein
LLGSHGEALAAAISQSAPEVKAGMVQDLLNMACGLDPELVLPFLGDPDPRTRRAVNRRLCLSAQQFLGHLIKAAVTDAHWEIRLEALQAIRRCQPGAADVAALTPGERDPDLYVRAQVVEILNRWRAR